MYNAASFLNINKNTFKNTLVNQIGLSNELDINKSNIETHLGNTDEAKLKK